MHSYVSYVSPYVWYVSYVEFALTRIIILTLTLTLTLSHPGHTYARSRLPSHVYLRLHLHSPSHLHPHSHLHSHPPPTPLEGGAAADLLTYSLTYILTYPDLLTLHSKEALQQLAHDANSVLFSGDRLQLLSDLKRLDVDGGNREEEHVSAGCEGTSKG